MDSYVPGDFKVNSFSIKGLKVDHGFISGSVYESIFMPCVVAEFNLRDTDDALFGGLNLSGGEPISFEFQTPGGEKSKYSLLVNRPENLEVSSGVKSRTFKLICTSEEAFYAAGGVDTKGYIQKSYVGKLISANVRDVLLSYLKTTKNIEVEVTKGPQNIIAQNEKVWPFIDRIRRRAVSTFNESASYVFFENKDGFKFVTIEGLFERPVVKKFVHDNTVGADSRKLTDNNIFAYQLPDMFDAMERIDKGTMKSAYSTFNFETNEYIEKSIDFPSKDTTTGGTKDWDSREFINKFGKFPGRSSIIPYDNRLPVTSIAEHTPSQLAYAGHLQQGLIKLRVYGDSKLKAGDLIEAKIPRPQSSTGNSKTDSDVSGKMLIASIRHMFLPEGQKPRYSCVLECIKGRPS